MLGSTKTLAHSAKTRAVARCVWPVPVPTIDLRLFEIETRQIAMHREKNDGHLVADGLRPRAPRRPFGRCARPNVFRHPGIAVRTLLRLPPAGMASQGGRAAAASP